MNTQNSSSEEKPYYHTFTEGDLFHVYNRSNNKEIIFPDYRSYREFLAGFQYYLYDYVRLLAYCIMGNHFHYAIQIRKENEIRKNLHDKSRRGRALTPTQTRFLDPKEDVDISTLLSQQFSNYFNSYAQRYNRQNNRNGNLFNSNVNRLKVIDKDQLKWLIYYIHANPWHHGKMDEYQAYSWSSYQEIVQGKLDVIDSVINTVFKSSKEFLDFHQHAHGLKVIKSLVFKRDHPESENENDLRILTPVKI